MVLSQALVDPYRLAQKYSLMLFDPADVIKSIRELREIRGRHLLEHIEICKQMIREELLYDVQVKNEAETLYLELMKQ